MKIEIKEQSDDKVKIEVHDNTTLVNLINENIWIAEGEKKGFGFAAYAIEHPYLSKPVLTVKGKDPKKILINAAEHIIDDIKDLKKQLQNVK
ncbi:MAG TPA: RpoL/Rpb11 RNA polymerase subunit family protein [archaeon]|nr:RpoL/Rpb11 RNA polymerase subunit family protein [archaeon]